MLIMELGKALFATFALIAFLIAIKPKKRRKIPALDFQKLPDGTRIKFN